MNGINKDYVQGGTIRYFGEELCYDYGFDNQLFDGNVAGIKWKGYNDTAHRAYGYTYDNSGRLLKADFSQLTTGAWDQAAGINYDVKIGDGNNYASAYDANGNILRMQQWGIKGGVSAQLDDITYSYEKAGLTFSNKLQRVTDAYNDTTSTLSDFKDFNGGALVDYAYDANGNFISDQNKRIANVTYNYLNLPDIITVAGKGTIQYNYASDGSKLRKTVTDNTVSPARITVTDYLGGSVFKNDSLQYVGYSAGRVRPVYEIGQPVTFVYDYYLRDHVGNTRTVLTEQTSVSSYLATMETNKAAVENALFSNIETTRKAAPAGYPEQTADHQYVAGLNGNDRRRMIGPSLILKVMAGDTIRMGVKAFYKSQVPVKAKNTGPESQILTALAEAFGGQAQAGAKGGQGAQRNSPFTDNVSTNQYRRLKEKSQDVYNPNRPKAYLNFVLFDDRLKLVEPNSGVKQVAEGADQLQVLGSDEMVMSESGFLYVYTSNESPQEIYFDDLSVTLAAGPVLEENHYYPFGGLMEAISGKAPTVTANRIRFNGKELQDEEWADGSGLEMYDFGARMYDPQLGRWHAVDPLAESYQDFSPYNFGANNPVVYYDKDGRFLGTILGGIIGGVVGGVKSMAKGESFWKGAGRGAISGLAAGAAFDLVVATGGTAAPLVAMMAAGAASGAVGNGVDQAFAILSGEQKSFSIGQFGASVGIGALTAGVLGRWGGGTGGSVARLIITPAGRATASVSWNLVMGPTLTAEQMLVMEATMASNVNRLLISTIPEGGASGSDDAEGDGQSSGGNKQDNTSGASAGVSGNVPKLKPEGSYLGSKKHGLKWDQGFARAKAEETPQGKWGSKMELDYAGEKAATLAPRGAFQTFPLPPGSKSVVYFPDGTIKPATHFKVGNNGTGTFHGYPIVIE